MANSKRSYQRADRAKPREPKFNPDELLKSIRSMGGVKRKKGDLVTGTVTGVYSNHVFIENTDERLRGILHVSKIGRKPDGTERRAQETLEKLEVGMELEIRIVNEPKHATVGAAQFGGEKLEFSTDLLPLPISEVAEIAEEPPSDSPFAALHGFEIVIDGYEVKFPESDPEPESAPAPEPLEEKQVIPEEPEATEEPPQVPALIGTMFRSAEDLMQAVLIAKDLINRVDAEIKRATAREEELHQKYVDLTHAIELGDFDDEASLAIMKMMKELRQERRRNKDIVSIAGPLADVLRANPSATHALNSAFNRMSSKAANFRSRAYTVKALTDMKETFRESGIRVWDE